MDPLIEIKRVPIEIKMEISHAKLEYTRGTTDMKISRDQDGLHIRSKPIPINMDKFELRHSAAPVKVHPAKQNMGYNNRLITCQATASCSEQGQLLFKAKLDHDIAALLSAGTQSHNIPSTTSAAINSNTALDTAELNISFEMDKASFDWRLTPTEFKYTPGTIEISVTQQPDVEITYIGGFIYVPPSADPDYEPIDTMA